MKSQLIKVLMVTGVMNRGGAETMIMNLYRNINRERIQFDFVENSFESAVFDNEIEKLGGKIYRCPHYNIKNHRQYVKWWYDFFEKHQSEYKIVHGHIGSTASIFLRIAQKYGMYTIAHSHSSGTDHSIKSLLYKIVTYSTRNIADYFFACSQVAGIDRFGEKITQENRYKVLNNAIETQKFSYNSELRHAVRDELGYDENNIIIGHIGRYTREKNHDFLLEVFKKIYDKNKNARLLMVGDGPLHDEMVANSVKLGISEAVIFTGVRDDVERLLQAMDVFVLPSLYEGLPVTMIEAQTSGVACVMSDVVPLETIVTENLVTVVSLKESPEVWANHIIRRADYERIDRRKEIIKSGYDIQNTVRWLEDFYLERAE